MKLKVKDKAINEIALNKQIYVVDKDGYVNIPDDSIVDNSLFEANTKANAKTTQNTDEAATATK